MYVWLAVMKTRAPRAPFRQVLNLSRAEQLVGPLFSSMPSAAKEAAQQVWSRAHSVVTSTSGLQAQFQLRVQAVLVCALVRWGWLPSRFSPLIRPLMDALRKESSPLLQELTGAALARLLFLVSRSAASGPNPCPKVVKNVCAMFMVAVPWAAVVEEGPQVILSKALAEQQPAGGRSSGARANSTTHEDDAACGLERQKRGAQLALQKLCTEFGGDLGSRLPALWDLLFVRCKARLEELSGGEGRGEEWETFWGPGLFLQKQQRFRMFQRTHC